MIPCVIWNKEALVIFLRLQIALTLQKNPKKFQTLLPFQNIVKGKVIFDRVS